MDLKSAALLALATVAAAGALVAPDLILVGRKLFAVRRKKSLHYAATMLALAALLGASGPHLLSWAILLVLMLLSLAWHLTYAYFGDALRPESLLLFVKPDHFTDAVEAGFADPLRLLPVLAVVGASIFAVLLVLFAAPDLGTTASAICGLACFGLLCAVAARAALWTKQSGAYPTIAMPAVLGTLHALALAIKWRVLDRLDPPRTSVGAMSYVLGVTDQGPATIAVIMGESIAPARMSLFGEVSGTTPRLDRRAGESGPFRLLVRRGFAAGVASNSSVAGFLGGSPFPQRAPGSRTLFDLARAQGFATHYLSAQKRSPLDLLGGVGAVDHVETQESVPDRVQARKDDALVDMVRDASGRERSFVFVYQRVNHAPYYNHQVGTPEPHHPHPASPREVIENYDIGLRSWDRNVDALLATLAERPGATFVFVTSDHGELLGEDGLWGHNISGSLRCAHVPMLLFTNRPEHPVAQAFASKSWLSAYEVASLAMQALGVEARASGHDPETFTVSNALPFGRAGYMAVKPTAGAAMFDVTEYDRAGAKTKQRIVSLATVAEGQAAPDSGRLPDWAERKVRNKKRRRAGAHRLRWWRVAGPDAPP